jgi:hypothetical protein
MMSVWLSSEGPSDWLSLVQGRAVGAAARRETSAVWQHGMNLPHEIDHPERFGDDRALEADNAVHVERVAANHEKPGTGSHDVTGEIEASFAGKDRVQDNQIEGSFGHPGAHFDTIRRRLDRETLSGQFIAEHRADAWLIIDDKNSFPILDLSTPRSCSLLT